MTLPVKITLLVAGLIILIVSLHSWFLYKQIDEGFSTQANQQMQFCATLLQHRVDNLKDNLQQEMSQLASSLFTENEGVLAAMLGPRTGFQHRGCAFRGEPSQKNYVAISHRDSSRRHHSQQQ